jgi:hypothetical protein
MICRAALVARGSCGKSWQIHFSEIICGINGRSSVTLHHRDNVILNPSKEPVYTNFNVRIFKRPESGHAI